MACLPPFLVRGISLFLLLFSFITLNAQTGSIYGVVLDKLGKPVEAANVAAVGRAGTITDPDGKFAVTVPAGIPIVLSVSHIRFERADETFTLKDGEIVNFNFELKPKVYQQATFEVVTERDRNSTMTRLDPKTVQVLPSATGGVEGILKTLPGVAKTNELTSQYSVRGGNYDENLVYVNDIEIYRPFLIRSGQQEGLSFINSDMVESVAFSAGGFEAEYGDKMSSVLDIRYRRPKDFRATATLSLLGGAFHVEDADKGLRLTYQLGVRQKSNSYLLNSLDTKGDYKPSFTDVQTLISYQFTEKFEMEFLGNLSRNRYRVVPSTRETSFGTFNEVLRLKVFFDGQEVDDYNTAMGAVSAIFHPEPGITLKLINSNFISDESNRFDIQGEYWLDELERDQSKEEFGESVVNRGVGTYLNHARNNLYALVNSLEHRGTAIKENHTFKWGLRYQHERIEDEISEWNMIDSAGFSLPQEPAGMIVLQDVIKTRVALESNRYSGFFQASRSFGDSTVFTVTAGIRGQYWDLNRQFVFSPRALFSMQPDWERDFLFRLSGGLYYQPPFYRELRDLEGNINTEVKAQQSYHIVFGTDYNFRAWDRPFKFIGEAYFKGMSNLVPYEYDNLRIRYFGENMAKGYAGGVDFKVNGEFVNGLESWFSLGVLSTREDLSNDQYTAYYDSLRNRTYPGYAFLNPVADSQVVSPGYIPRPTDQRVMAGLFFQDYLPRLPDLKMHLGLYFGTGLPFGPPDEDRYKDTLRMPPYRRVDIGFSYLLLGEEKVKGKKQAGEKSVFRGVKSLWVSAEVFNLLQISNTLDYFWIRDISNHLYAVPNYLTNRLVNVKVVARF